MKPQRTFELSICSLISSSQLQMDGWMNLYWFEPANNTHLKKNVFVSFSSIKMYLPSQRDHWYCTIILHIQSYYLSDCTDTIRWRFEPQRWLTGLHLFQAIFVVILIHFNYFNRTLFITYFKSHPAPAVTCSDGHSTSRVGCAIVKVVEVKLRRMGSFLCSPVENHWLRHVYQISKQQC